MKQVDFYLISNHVADAKYKLASRLSNKLSRMKLRALVVTDDLTSSKLLNKVMWSFNDTSFVAHDHVPNSGTTPSNIHITEAQQLTSQLLEQNYDVLINISERVPDFNQQFERIAEIVEQSESAKSAARERFKQYQNEGFELKTTPIEL